MRMRLTTVEASHWLKGSDRELRQVGRWARGLRFDLHYCIFVLQVLRVREMLKRGLGVHHAGQCQSLLCLLGIRASCACCAYWASFTVGRSAARLQPPAFYGSAGLRLSAEGIVSCNVCCPSLSRVLQSLPLFPSPVRPAAHCQGDSGDAILPRSHQGGELLGSELLKAFHLLRHGRLWRAAAVAGGKKVSCLFDPLRRGRLWHAAVGAVRQKVRFPLAGPPAAA